MSRCGRAGARWSHLVRGLVFLGVNLRAILWWMFVPVTVALAVLVGLLLTIPFVVLKGAYHYADGWSDRVIGCFERENEENA